jgi:hypothetical protein
MENQYYEDMYVVGTNIHCFRAGEPALIIGFKIDLKRERFVYIIRFSDNVTDAIPLIELNTIYEVISFKDIIKGNIPKIK